MTLILTWFSPHLAVQASDTRISSEKRGEDSARKCIFYEGQDARLTVAYTGLATLLDSHERKLVPIENWLIRQISGLPFGTGLLPMLQTLTTMIDRTVRETTHTYPNFRRFLPLTVLLT